MGTALTLPTVPVFFATSEGQTRRIAERMAGVLREDGVDSAAIDVADLEHAAVNWAAVRAAIVGASLHAGKHQRAAAAFVDAHVASLNAIPSAFFSVSLSAASQYPEEVQKAQELAEAFPAAEDWRPQVVASFGGRLAYSQYNLIVRFVMKRIARKEGAPTDTSRDYEFTDWSRVDALAHNVAVTVKAAAAA
jgi:menaquinone-dependent protoporphyrinogen oxidase